MERRVVTRPAFTQTGSSAIIGNQSEETTLGKRYDALNEDLAAFIRKQKIYFVATAASEGRVNLSPKGMDTLKVLDRNRALWLNLTGSGNETAAHVRENPRMTILFCSFEEAPLILRLYGEARMIRPEDPEWDALFAHFDPNPGARQIFDLSIDLVQTSCGFGVPYYSYAGERDTLKEWAERKGEKGIRKYWEEKNSTSLDGKPA